MMSLVPHFDPPLPAPGALPAEPRELAAAYDRLYRLAKTLTEATRSFASHCEDIPGEHLPPQAPCWTEAKYALVQAGRAGLLDMEKHIPSFIKERI